MSFRVLKNSTIALALGLSFACSNTVTTADLSKSSDSESKKVFGVKAVTSTAPSVAPSCPPPPPPPPIPADVLAKIKAENPSLLTVLDSLKTMTFEAGHAKMTELAKTYPQYFKAPPPLPPAGTCPPPPPAGQQPPAPAPSGSAKPSVGPSMPPPPPAPSGAPSMPPPPSGSAKPSGAPSMPPPPPPAPSVKPSAAPALTIAAVAPSAAPKPSVAPSCPPPPPPPPIPANVLAKIKKENPSLLTVLDSLKTMTFQAGHAKMTELAKKYPQYFKAPPPLPPAGTCPPPPPRR